MTDESDTIHDFAGLAHLVEQLICNHQVAGSSPAAGTKYLSEEILGNSKTRDSIRLHGFFYSGSVQWCPSESGGMWGHHRGNLSNLANAPGKSASKRCKVGALCR